MGSVSFIFISNPCDMGPEKSEYTLAMNNQDVNSATLTLHKSQKEIRFQRSICGLCMITAVFFHPYSNAY